MWLATKYGWFSIVRKEGHFHIRARQRQDLQNLLAAMGEDVPIEDWPEADYRWRIRVPEEDGARIDAVWAALRESVDYGNFKSEVARQPSQRAKLPIYHEIWALMARLQEP